MDNNQEESIVVKELKENEYCEIQFKQDKLFLNNKDITNMRDELFKIFKQSTILLQNQLLYQEIELTKLFGQNILNSKIINSANYLISPPDVANNININNNPNNHDNEKLTQFSLTKNQYSKNDILQDSYKNNLISQYMSIISMEQFIQENKNTQQLIQNPKHQDEEQNQKYNLKLVQDKYNLKQQSNIEMIQFTENESQIIKFISPLNQTQQISEIFHLKLKMKLELFTYYIQCQQCEKKLNKLEVMNALFERIKKVLIIQNITVTIDGLDMCDHLNAGSIGQIGQGKPYINLLFDDLTNLKYSSLQINGYELGYAQVLHSKIKIVQNNSLKYLEFKNLLFQIIEIQQKQNQFLSCLILSSFGLKFLSELKFQQYLANIRFSELRIYYVKECKKFYKLRHFQFLYYAKREDNNEINTVLEEEIKIINKRYTNILCFFALHKQFKEDFSIYRLAYDLYDQ